MKQTTLSSELDSLRKNIEEAEAEQESYTELMSKEDAAKVTAPVEHATTMNGACRRGRSVDCRRTQTAPP